ncbi:hypothetical protein [uncultured Rhodoblastus sp.]|uniref:hypothetical protein n=1 Tax=uncultured Rhodoblastus sp. TaxID=543037 RepID=UPI0025F0C728|nr:hypothetical protein [uncultured Rhodoblastus sp.]
MKNPLPPKSRYAGSQVLTRKLRDGREVAYLSRRFVPPPSQFATLQRHLVTQGERLDRLAAQYLGDPEMFWLIADANLAFDPADLTATPGRQLRITLPAGLPGPPEN